MNEIKIEFIHKKFHVSVSNNRFQWNTIYRNSDLDKSEIIEQAFIKVGYKQINYN